MLQMGIGWRAAFCAIVTVLMWPVALPAAEETAPAPTGGGIARPSVEELAIPPQTPEEAARETDTREAMNAVTMRSMTRGLPEKRAHHRKFSQRLKLDLGPTGGAGILSGAANALALTHGFAIARKP